MPQSRFSDTLCKAQSWLLSKVGPSSPVIQGYAYTEAWRKQKRKSQVSKSLGFVGCTGEAEKVNMSKPLQTQTRSLCTEVDFRLSRVLKEAGEALAGLRHAWLSCKRDLASLHATGVPADSRASRSGIPTHTDMLATLGSPSSCGLNMNSD